MPSHDNNFIGAVLGTITLITGTPVWGQTVEPNDESGEIIITAQKRQQNLQDVPISVSVLNSTALTNRGVQSMGDLATAIPGAQFGEGSGVMVPYLRGVGSSATMVGNEASVAVYVDGVYFARLPIGFFSLNNIERVEVLKGPQGTLFGRNSSAGVVQLITEQPSDNAAVRGDISYDNFETLQGSLYATGAVADGVNANITVSGRHQNQGHGINETTGNRVGYHDELTARTKWTAAPSDTLDLAAAAFYARSKYSLEGNTYPGTSQGYMTAPFGVRQPQDFYDIFGEFDPYVKIDGWGLSLQADQELSFAKLTSISAYYYEKERLLSEGDFTERPDLTAYLGSRVKQFTQELQLSSLKSSDIDWIIGLYYINIFSTYDKIELRGPEIVGPDGLDSFSRQRANSWAGFGQLSYSPVASITITGGLRYTIDEIQGSGRTEIPSDPPFIIDQPPSDRETTKKLTFKVGADYKPSSNLMIYGSFSRGYKSGVYNLLTYNPVPTLPEEIDAYELGMKGNVNRIVRFAASIFQYNIKNPQVQLAQSAAVVLSNADKARVRGGELELDATLADGLNARASLTYLDAKYVKYLGAPSGPPAEPYGSTLPLIGIDASGNRMPQAPKVTLNIGGDYRLAIADSALIFSIDYYYNDGFFWEPDNFLRQKSYGNLSGQIRYDINTNLNVRIWGKNLTNEKVAAYAYTQAGPTGYPYATLAPRTLGITAGFNF